MVEPQGDGNERSVQYAKFRNDKQADPGYSADLVNVDTPPECYDDFNKLPVLDVPYNSILDIFLKSVEVRPNSKFMGSRIKNTDNTFGAYEWKTYQDVFVIYEEIAKGCKALHLLDVVPGVDEDGKEWAFAGIWSKNKWEWYVTLFAAMVCKATTIGFYDQMGDESVDYSVDQTQCQTMFCSAGYLKKILDMRDAGLIKSIKNIVIFDTDVNTEAQKRRASNEYHINVFTLDEVREAGRQNSAEVLHPEKIQRDDIYLLCYTSGTTGLSKGVKCSHWGIISLALIFNKNCSFTEQDCMVNYLPAPHIFDQFLVMSLLTVGGSFGFYSGDPSKLMEDCEVLKPTIFPSVPRLFNKIYSKIKTDLETQTGCKRWLYDKGLASKKHHLTSGQSASYNSPCYDYWVFNDVAKKLGGNVRLMITASSPISKDVQEFLKVAFSCPMIECYGLSETSGAMTCTRVEDPISGMIGGPFMNTAIRIKDLPELDYRITDKPYPRGEICMRGPMITSGYFAQPVKTAESIDAQGYLHSGDVGVVFPNGNIQVLDRCKNIFKLSQGVYVAPEKVENILIQSNYIMQALVYGHSLKDCCVAIIVPDMEVVKKWATENGKDFQAIFKKQDADLRAIILSEIDQIGRIRKLSSLERPKEIYISSDPFSVENDIVTPSFKLKRNIGQKVYQTQIDAMYLALAARGQ